MFAPGLITSRAATRRRRGRPALAFTSVMMFFGDSQVAAQTTAADQTAAAAGYTFDPNVFVLNSAGQFVPYRPSGTGAICGMVNGANSPSVAMEMEAIKRFRARFPYDPLYIIKDARPGSLLTRGAPLQAGATLTASIGNAAQNAAGNLLTHAAAYSNAAATAANNPANGSLIVGAGVPEGVSVLGSAGATQKYVGLIGSAPNLNISVPSTAMTLFNAGIAWDAIEGQIYSGSPGNPNSGARQRWVNAWNLLVALGLNPKVVSVLIGLGTNDKAGTGGNLFGASFRRTLASLRANVLMPEAKIFVPRPMSGGTTGATVRTQLAAEAVNDPLVRVINMDAQAVHDGTHWVMAAQNYVGVQIDTGVWVG